MAKRNEFLTVQSGGRRVVPGPENLSLSLKTSPTSTYGGERNNITQQSSYSIIVVMLGGIWGGGITHGN